LASQKSKNKMARDNFSVNIKFVLAQRAGYLCSICTQSTIGPSSESDTSVNLTGIAAHISAASPGGRRFDANLTSEQRSDISNGIWLCNTHADLIDGDEITYTTEYLKQVKANHEQKIQFKQSGITPERGAIVKIDFSNLGVVTKPVTMEFADKNIVVSNNGLGKTLMCEFLASLANKKFLKRWTKRRSGEALNSYFNIYYFKNSLDKFSIHIDINNTISYSLNDSPIPILETPLRILYLRQSFWEFLRKISDEQRKELSLINLLASYFEISEKELVNVIHSIIRDKKIFVNDISFNDKEDDLLVKMSSRPESGRFRFWALSGGEQERVIIEIALKIAVYYAKFNSTVLIIDSNSISIIDSAGINRLFESIRSGGFNFQFFFTCLPDRGYDMRGFNVHQLGIAQGGEVEAKRIHL